jgi:CSLREA domain-containing protein
MITNITNRLRWLCAILLIAGLAILASLAPTAYAATIAVNTTADELNADGDCSLREAIRAANTNTAVDACPAGSGADIISLPAGTYQLAIAGTNEDAALTGDLDITEALTLRGAGKAVTAIDAAGLDRVFHVLAGPTVIRGVRITGGFSGGAFGGGIYLNSGDLTLDDIRVTNNGGNVGGIQADPGTTLTMLDSRVDANSGASAGGIQIGASATAIITNSEISNNTSSGSNAGIINVGTLSLVNSTISGNSAPGDSGGLRSNGTTNVFSVTIANNTADSDGNNSGDGGGLYITGGTLSIQNSIIADNTDNSPLVSDPDCFGSLTSQGHNLISNLSGCTITGSTVGNLTGLAPALGSLQDNGGRTHTQALLTGSPAINAGAPNGCVDNNGVTLTTDQRGFVRNGRCDMGAYEFNSLGTPTPTASNTPTPTRTPTASNTSPTGTRPPIDGATPTSTATNTPGPSPTGTLTATRSPIDGPSPTPIAEAPPLHVLYVPIILQ